MNIPSGNKYGLPSQNVVEKNVLCGKVTKLPDLTVLIKTTLVHNNLNKIIPYDYRHSNRIDNIYLPAKGKAGSAAPFAIQNIYCSYEPIIWLPPVHVIT
jgi:hypothetical protein